MCIWPQHVCSSGKSTSQPSRSSSRTTARPVCGNRVSLKQVTKRETRMRLPFRKVFGLDGREVTAGAGPSWGEGPPPQTEGAAERQPTDLSPLVKELRVEEGLLISLTRMRRILEVDLANQRVVVEPGVTNIAVSQAVAPDHFYPPDPSSQIVCTIGGNVAENSGGAHCFKYGFTTNYVTGLELVLPDGELVQLGGKELDSPGSDLIGAFVGSEGTLGIATRIWLRIVPKPETVRTLVAFFGSPIQAGEVVSEIVSSGIVPGAIEMMDNLSIRAAEGYTGAGYPTDAGAALVVELDGSEAECETRFDEVVAICEAAGADSIRVAADEAEREVIWQARKAAFAAMGRIAPNYYVQDSVIPRTRLAEVLGRIEELAREYDLQVANVFHAGDGNLHPLVCYDASNPGEAERAEECAGLIVKACVDAGGSITGEHGVGVDKKRYMPEMFSDNHLRRLPRLPR